MSSHVNYMLLRIHVVTEAETACQKWGGSAFMKLGVIYIHSEYIQHRLLHSSWQPPILGGLSPPLSKSGGAQAPLPPQVLCLWVSIYWYTWSHALCAPVLWGHCIFPLRHWDCEILWSSSVARGCGQTHPLLQWTQHYIVNHYMFLLLHMCTHVPL